MVVAEKFGTDWGNDEPLPIPSQEPEINTLPQNAYGGVGLMYLLYEDVTLQNAIASRIFVLFRVIEATK